jgi:hypothetical protein
VQTDICNDGELMHVSEFVDRVFDGWRNVERPGYFGRRRDEKIAQLNATYGEGNWRLAWLTQETLCFTFRQACCYFYEQSYYEWLSNRPADVDFICSFGECIDNAPTNVSSGLDYEKQEAFSTHIQDIAVRTVLRRLGREFSGSKDKILVIRSKDSSGYRYGPGNVPFMDPNWIIQPSLRPSWAKSDSVEDFWQSNKWLQVKGDADA